MLRHRKNKRRGTLDRGRGKQRENSERIAQKGDYIHKQQLKTKTVWLWLCYVDKKRFNKVTDSLVFGELWGVLGFSLKHHLNKKSIKNIITHILNIFSNSVSYCIFKISHWGSSGDTFFTSFRGEIKWIHKIRTCYQLKREIREGRVSFRRRVWT